MANLSPHYDENEEISSLRSNFNLAGENDGDHQAKLSNATEEVKEVQRSVNEVKEIHAIARNALPQNYSLLSSSTKNWPDFAYLLQQEELGASDGDLYPLYVQEVGFPIKKFQVIWSSFGWSN